MIHVDFLLTCSLLIINWKYLCVYYKVPQLRSGQQVVDLSVLILFLRQFCCCGSLGIRTFN